MPVAAFFCHAFRSKQPIGTGWDTKKGNRGAKFDKEMNIAKNNDTNLPDPFGNCTRAHLKYCLRHAPGTLEESNLRICKTE
jgi:hypothetical protein